ncbi:MAG: TldD/PmbA family protein [Theionarchaea archaeon]|nr:TldD/PmbA family protein [Theionarchaea archaeon]
MKEDVLSLLEKVMSLSTADQCEAYFSRMSWGLTRFANSYIHQNVMEDNADLTVRVVLGKKIGKARTNLLEPESLKEVVERAAKIAKAQEETPDFVSLPSPAPISQAKGFVKETAEVTPEDRAQTVKASVDFAEAKGIKTVSGTYYSGTEEVAVMNSLGIEAYFTGTISSFKINTAVDEGTGVAQHFARNHRNLNPEALTERACAKALASRKTESVPPRTYEVILEEQAVCEMMGYLGFMTFGAQAYQEGRSAFSGHLGDKLASENVTIWDDGLNEEGFPLPFDVEGVGKQKRDFIVKGVAQNVAYDSFYAHKEGKKSTGHAIDAPMPVGPGPTNLFMEKGTLKQEDLISNCDNGILVTRFHYTNPMHRLKTIITGMTRDGTFLIEKGEITKGLKNLRFTQSVLGALSEVEGISDTWGTSRMEYMKATVCAPAVHVREFAFTGSTLF